MTILKEELNKRINKFFNDNKHLFDEDGFLNIGYKVYTGDGKGNLVRIEQTEQFDKAMKKLCLKLKSK